MMTDLQTLYFEKPHKLIHEFKNGAVIDTNMLILDIIGMIDKRKNTHYLQQLSYKPYDYHTFILFKENMKLDRVIVTPNILTEFFNIIQNKLGKTFFPNNYLIDNPLASDGFITNTLEQLRQSAQIGISRKD